MKNESTRLDVVLSHIDVIPSDYFDDFRRDVPDNQIDLREEQRENVAYMAIEWMIPTAVVLYVGLKFVDAFVERAGEDFADLVYPRFKDAVKRLATKILVRDRDSFRAISSTGKLTTDDALAFSILSETRHKQRIKFVFHERMTEVQCEETIEQVFICLLEHHDHNGTGDRLSRGMASVPALRSGDVYLCFDKAASQWNVINPVAELHKRQSAQKRPALD